MCVELEDGCRLECRRLTQIFFGGSKKFEKRLNFTTNSLKVVANTIVHRFQWKSFCGKGFWCRISWKSFGWMLRIFKMASRMRQSCQQSCNFAKAGKFLRDFHKERKELLVSFTVLSKHSVEPFLSGWKGRKICLRVKSWPKVHWTFTENRKFSVWRVRTEILKVEIVLLGGIRRAVGFVADFVVCFGATVLVSLKRFWEISRWRSLWRYDHEGQGDWRKARTWAIRLLSFDFEHSRFRFWVQSNVVTVWPVFVSSTGENPSWRSQGDLTTRVQATRGKRNIDNSVLKVPPPPNELLFYFLQLTRFCLHSIERLLDFYWNQANTRIQGSGWVREGEGARATCRGGRGWSCLIQPGAHSVPLLAWRACVWRCACGVGKRVIARVQEELNDLTQKMKEIFPFLIRQDVDAADVTSRQRRRRRRGRRATLTSRYDDVVGELGRCRDDAGWRKLRNRRWGVSFAVASRGSRSFCAEVRRAAIGEKRSSNMWPEISAPRRA